MNTRPYFGVLLEGSPTHRILDLNEGTKLIRRHYSASVKKTVLYHHDYLIILRWIGVWCSPTGETLFVLKVLSDSNDTFESMFAWNRHEAYWKIFERDWDISMRQEKLRSLFHFLGGKGLVNELTSHCR
jgi:hypothetical protein